MKPKLSDYLHHHKGCQFLYSGTKDTTLYDLDEERLLVIKQDNDYKDITPVLRTLHDITDEEAKYVAFKALADCNMQNPVVIKTKSEGVNVVLIIDDENEGYGLYDINEEYDLIKDDFDHIEIDSGFTVIEKYNCLANMSDITKFFLEKNFDVFNLIYHELAISTNDQMFKE